ncbi:MAG TPA: PQQ-binding-like beta-propeller repeat protein [Abditibacteriaceae bacterium]|jgi:hypothetical protein
MAGLTTIASRELPAQSRTGNMPRAVKPASRAVKPASKAGLSRTAQPPVHSLTFHYDNARLGWNNRETKLTPTSVRPESFGKLWDQPLDGFVNGSPLQVSGIAVGGRKRDVVYAATERNSVYALDAATGKVLWSRRQMAPPITAMEFSGEWRTNIVHGVLSTPVIDLAGGTIYVCGIHAPGLRQQFVVWALDIRTGKTRPGWPVVVRGSYRGTPFVPGQVMQRGALSLVNGWVYVPFGGRGDTPPWRGWVMGINTRRPATPQRTFCTSPFSDGAGVWSAAGVAADRNGDLFLVTGNGDFDLFRGGHNLGQTVLRLRPRGQQLQFSRQRPDYYTPPNYKHLDDQDEDMGGATAIVLPDQRATRTPRLLFTGGKDGLGYLLNRDRLGGIGGELQKQRFYGDPKAIYHEGVRATPAYFDAGSKGRFVFLAGDETGPQNQNGIVALRLTTNGANGPARVQQVWTIKQHVERPTSPVVTSQGSRNGIVWTVETRDEPNPVLRAYDALSGRELYHSDMGPETDRLIGARRFVSPTVVNGRVFIGARGVFAYGLVKRVATATATTPTSAVTAPAVTAPAVTAAAVAPTSDTTLAANVAPEAGTSATATATATPTPTPEPMNFLQGTVVSLRGNILVIRPSLRPRQERVAFDERTEIVSNSRTDKSKLKPGQRISVAGSYDEKEGFSVRWIEYSEQPISYLQEKSQGLTIEPGQGWASGRGTLKSVEPFVFADDKGQEFTSPLDRLRGVWQLKVGDRNTLLIGTRVNIVGKAAPDGVIAAKTIQPERSISPTGTMFGRILSVKGRTLQIRPRYTSDTLKVTLTPNARLMRQITVEPESIKVGQAVTFWAEQRNRPTDRQPSTDLKALALLLGPLRYPAATGDDAPRYFSGKLQSLRPVRLQLAKEGSVRVLPTAQMVIARLTALSQRGLKTGDDSMFVLSRRPDGSFDASTVIVDAPPWVGYGG